MIKEEELFRVGKSLKPHGIQGELSVIFDNHAFDLDDCPFLVLNIDGIFVPFFIENYRFKTDTAALLKLEGIASEEAAKRLSGQPLFLPLKYRQINEEEQADIRYFIGFTVEDSAQGKLGRITEIDDSTLNTLFILSDKNGDEILIPATDDFIDNIDETKQIIYMTLPEGLLE
jgi:16S rRNA processing protein RimM